MSGRFPRLGGDPAYIFSGTDVAPKGAKMKIVFRFLDGQHPFIPPQSQPQCLNVLGSISRARSTENLVKITRITGPVTIALITESDL